MAKLVPVWKIVQETFAERGIKLTPKLTLVLCDKIAREINEKLQKEASKEGSSNTLRDLKRRGI